MTEPNHNLTDSEAQAFQPELHVMHLLQRAAKRVAGTPPSSSATVADAPQADASEERDGQSASSER